MLEYDINAYKKSKNEPLLDGSDEDLFNDIDKAVHTAHDARLERRVKKAKKVKSDDEKITCFDLYSALPILKENHPYFYKFKDAPAQSLQVTLKTLYLAKKSFYRRVKEKKEGASVRGGFPKFKPYHKYRSIVYPQMGFYINDVLCKKVNGAGLKIDYHKQILSLSKIGNFRMHMHRPIMGVVKTCQIKKSHANKLYITFSCELPTKCIVEKPKPKVVAVSLSYNNKVCTWDGVKEKTYEREYLTGKFEQGINKRNKIFQRKLKINKERSLKKEEDVDGCRFSSNRQEKARVKLAKTYEKLETSRREYNHILSANIVRNYDVIVIRKQDIIGEISKISNSVKKSKKNNLKNAEALRKEECLIKKITDCAHSQLIEFIKYKSEHSGKVFYEIDSNEIPISIDYKSLIVEAKSLYDAYISVEQGT